MCNVTNYTLVFSCEATQETTHVCLSVRPCGPVSFFLSLTILNMQTRPTKTNQPKPLKQNQQNKTIETKTNKTKTNKTKKQQNKNPKNKLTKSN